MTGQYGIRDKLEDELIRGYQRFIELETAKNKLQHYTLLDFLIPNMDEVAYIADPKTYKILYASNDLNNSFSKEIVGGICYRDLHGLEIPCEFCSNNTCFNVEGKQKVKELHNLLLDKCFLVVDKVIQFPGGHDVRFEYGIDITERKKVEQLVRYRLRFEETVKRISSRFVGVHDWDRAIYRSLADMGSLAGADRAYLFMLRKEFLDNTHEWCASGVSSEMDNLQNITADMIPWWMAKLSKGEIICIKDVSQMPEEARVEKGILESQNIKSVLVLPLYVKGVLYGFLGFDNVRDTCLWSDNDLELLSIASEIIGNALERRKMEDALRESESWYRTIFENTGAATIIIEEDGTIGMVNAEFEKLVGASKREVEGSKNWTNYLVKQDSEKIRYYHHMRKINPECVPKTYEARFRDAHNNVKDIIVTASILPGTKKTVVSLLDITERKKVEQKIQVYQKQLKSLAAELSLIEERERRNIANDIHDYIGQSLAVAGMKLGVLRKSLKDNHLIEKVDQIRRRIEETIQYTRSLVFDLSPPILYDLGFEAALDWLGEKMLEQYGLQVNIKHCPQPKLMDDELRGFLFKAVRELLTNIVKYAGTDTAFVSVYKEGDGIKIIVRDYGVGFNIDRLDAEVDKSAGFGLFSMRERLEYLGGSMNVESGSGLGTRITLEVPHRCR